MRLAERSDYGLRVLMLLAVSPDSLTVAEMSQRLAVSHHHLVKVVQWLRDAELLTTVRGRGGGVRLARAPADIRIGEVVRATEPDFAIAECFRPEGACALEKGCRLSGLLQRGVDAFLEALNQATLADLVQPPPVSLRRLAGTG
ncbi:MAG: RrF2 family transcriptional regulator [Phycisphaerales bacterium JB039]